MSVRRRTLELGHILCPGVGQDDAEHAEEHLT